MKFLAGLILGLLMASAAAQQSQQWRTLTSGTTQAIQVDENGYVICSDKRP